jgi:hypothetical protein
MATVWRRSSSCSSRDRLKGGSEQAESPECTPACSMCSMMPPMTPLAVAHRIDVDLDRVVEEAVEQHRRVVGHLHRLAHVALEVGSGARSPSRARPARRTGAPPADSRSPRPAAAPLRAARGAVGRLLEPSLWSSFWKRSRSSAQSIGMSGVVPMIGTPLRLEVARQLERRLAAELHDHALGLLDGDDLQHVLERQRLEIEAVGGVVVGRDGLRVAVDHDGLEAVLAQRERRVHAAVVELDALADAVGPAAQHHDLARSVGATSHSSS